MKYLRMFIRKLLEKKKLMNIEELDGHVLQVVLKLLLMHYYAHGKQLNLKYKLQKLEHSHIL